MDKKTLIGNPLPKLPDYPVKTGESWTTPVDITATSGQLTGASKGEATNVIAGIETIQGMECVKIESHFKLTVEGSQTGMEQAWKSKGDESVTSTWYFVYKKGMLVK